MRKAQGLLLNLLAILLLAADVVLVVSNLHSTMTARFAGEVLPGVPMGALLGLSAVLLGGSVGLVMLERMLHTGQQQRRTGRELERKEVSREEAEAKVKTLENKVETLEKALNAALKSKQS